jgi:RimJ/RimL family protein N-acetyltransferase
MPHPRFQYALALEDAPVAASAGPSFRTPQSTDLEQLARLMLDAYVGTIDYEGETLADAREEVASYLDGWPLLQQSLVHVSDDDVDCACLVSYLEHSGSPLVAYIMTARARKGAGLARQALCGALAQLKAAGYDHVMATITDGNVPSEKLFTSLGFSRVSPRRPPEGRSPPEAG